MYPKWLKFISFPWVQKCNLSTWKFLMKPVTWMEVLIHGKCADVNIIWLNNWLLPVITALYTHVCKTYYAVEMPVCPAARSSFLHFFSTCCRYQLKTCCIQSVGGTTRIISISLQAGHWILLYSKTQIKFIFSAFMSLSIYAYIQ